MDHINIPKFCTGQTVLQNSNNETIDTTTVRHGPFFTRKESKDLFVWQSMLSKQCFHPNYTFLPFCFLDQQAVSHKAGGIAGQTWPAGCQFDAPVIGFVLILCLINETKFLMNC